MAAHRYRMNDLRKQAIDKILQHLGSSDAIAFLFHSVYLFRELRVPVIEHITKTRHTEIVKKENRVKYKDHPEFSEPLGELFEAYRNLRNN